MNDKKRKKKSVAADLPEEPWKPTSEETEVAKYLHRKLPQREGKLSGMIVRIFIAVEALELLMNSPWAQAEPNSTSCKNVKTQMFSDQQSVVGFMNTLMQKQMFHRAVRVKKKVVIKRREDTKLTKPKIKRDLDGKTSESHSNLKALGDVTNTKLFRKSDANESGLGFNYSSSPSSLNKPVRIEMAEEQVFITDDPNSVYVWIYEPPPGLFNWIAGSALLIGIILCCLFPIWPSQLRLGAYYLTILGSCLLGLLLSVALIRLSLYVFVWLFTFGRYSFWIFPNYFEDCGFFESFRPLYTIALVTTNTKSDSIAKKDKSKSKLVANCTSATTVDAIHLEKSNKSATIKKD